MQQNIAPFKYESPQCGFILVTEKTSYKSEDEPNTLFSCSLFAYQEVDKLNLESLILPCIKTLLLGDTDMAHSDTCSYRKHLF